MLIHLGLYYALRFGNCVHSTFIFTFLCSILKVFWIWLYDIQYFYVIQKTKTKLHTVEWPQVIIIFYTSVSWWILIGVWVTVSFLKSLGTFLSILADLNAVVRMLSTRTLIFKSHSPCINSFVTEPIALNTIGVIVIYYQ